MLIKLTSIAGLEIQIGIFYFLRKLFALQLFLQGALRAVFSSSNFLSTQEHTFKESRLSYCRVHSVAYKHFALLSRFASTGILTKRARHAKLSHYKVNTNNTVC